MKTQLGVWIDHKSAVIVALLDSHVETRIVESNASRHIKATDGKSSYAPNGGRDITPDDIREREFAEQLNVYYERVLAAMASADNIYIMGPGEAKDELCKHLEKAGLSMRICTVEAAQRLSGRQIVARVKEYFNKVPARSY
jgi:stalled ribosome rescue protein Dom34